VSLIRLFQCKDSHSKKEWLAAYQEARNLQKEAANTKVLLLKMYLTVLVAWGLS
jgi:hypothetical protein